MTVFDDLRQMESELEELHHREYYKPEERAWKVFPPHSDIREART